MNEKLQKYIENKKYDLALQFIHKIQKKEYSLEYHNYKIVIYLLSQKFDAAQAELTVLLSKFPNDPTLLCNMGLAYKGKKNFDHAIHYLSKSLQLEPENLNISLNLIETHIEVFNFTKAIELLNKIIQRNLRMERCYQLLAYCYREINLFEESHKNLELAIENNPYNYENFYHLGFSFIWKKNYQEAMECFKKCYELNNKYLPALYQLNNLLKFDSDSPYYNILVNINDRDCDQYNCAYKYLTISEVHYRKNDYNNFFKYLHQANNLRGLHSKKKEYDPHFIQASYTKIPDLIIDDIKFTPIFILGMPRSGSSVLEQIISQADDVYAAGEIPLLHEQFDHLIHLNQNKIDQLSLIKIRENYLSYLSMLPNTKFIIDKLPLNFLWIGFIKSIFPNAIFIHTIRNKLDICMSLYRTFFADNVLEFSYNLKDINNFYTIYKSMMDFWYSSGLKILDFNYDDFISNPQEQIQSLFRKLNFEYNESFLDLHNINRPVKTASFLQVRDNIKKSSNPNWHDFQHEIAILFES